MHSDPASAAACGRCADYLMPRLSHLQEIILAIFWLSSEASFHIIYVHNLYTGFLLFLISRGFHSTVIWGQLTWDKELAQLLPSQQACLPCLYLVLLKTRFLWPKGLENNYWCIGWFHCWCPMVMTLTWDKICRDETFLAGTLDLGSDTVCLVHWTLLFQGQVT